MRHGIDAWKLALWSSCYHVDNVCTVVNELSMRSLDGGIYFCMVMLFIMPVERSKVGDHLGDWLGTSPSPLGRSGCKQSWCSFSFAPSSSHRPPVTEHLCKLRFVLSTVPCWPRPKRGCFNSFYSIHFPILTPLWVSGTPQFGYEDSRLSPLSLSVTRCSDAFKFGSFHFFGGLSNEELGLWNC